MEEIKKIFTQTSWQITGKLFGIIASFFVISIVARNYDQEGTGIYTQVINFLIFFHIAADLGLNGYFLPKLQENPRYANLLFNFRIWLSFLLILILISITPLLPFNNNSFNISVYLGSITILLFSIFSSTSLIFQSRLRYDLSNLAMAVSSLALIPAILLITTLKMPASLLILANVFGWIVNISLSLMLVKRFYKFKLEPLNFKFPVETFRLAWPLTLTLLINTIYFRVDSFILTGTKSFAEVGIYNVAFQVFQNAITIPTFIMNSFYPMMIIIFHQNKSRFLYQLQTAGIVLFFLSLMGVILVYFLSPGIIHLLVGSRFEGSVEALKILSFGFPAFFLTALLMWVFVLIGKQKVMFYIYLIGLIVNIILNWIFIPQYSYLASSWITGISEYLILVLQLGILWKEFKGGDK